MTVIETDDFIRARGKLPTQAQRLYTTQRARFETNLRDPRLHVKKLHGLDDVYSFRVTRNYRVLFYFHTDDAVVFFTISARKNVYKRL
jgi:mRNA-degrading endonuclease RelE of RelBE toxin-antitoxin system